MKSRRVPAPISIRFSDMAKLRLQTLGDQFGVTPSDLIRAAVGEKLIQWESEGYVVLKKATA